MIVRGIRYSAYLLAVILTSWMAGGAAADELRNAVPEGLRIESVAVWPERVELDGALAYRQLLVSGRLNTGETVDLTRSVEVRQASPLAQLDASGRVTPLLDGQGELLLAYEGFEISVAIEVRHAQTTPESSFVQDVQPALSRMGCNQGTCHGSKDGKNGFKLSLRGYDPLYDHRALTDDIGARRFNRAAPDQSLMLLKATGSIPHVGGVVTTVDHPYYTIIRQWIASGAALDLDSSRVVSIDVQPHNPMIARPGMTQQMAVVATYSDGSRRDVTREAFVESGNIEVAESLPGGMVRVLRRGEAAILVRYEGAYVATTLTVMGDRSGFEWPNPETYNYIDTLVYEKLQRIKVEPAELCTDSEFIRRVSLDLTGLPPSLDEVRRFLADPAPSRQKREALVDRLVGCSQYVEHWTNKWADLLQVNRKFLGESGAAMLRDWIKQGVAANKPYDQFAYEVLTASGSTADNPPASYYKILRDPAETMENTTHLFLAIRFNCNKCHDHPFERWTQDQYYHLAAFFAQVVLKEDPAFAEQKIGGSAVEGAKPLVEVVFDQSQGDVTHDRTGQIAPPTFPYDHSGEVDSEASRREQLAQWVTAAENPYFAKSFANRIWGYLFGVGIIEPIDDVRAGNPATNPELLDALTRDLIEHDFDMQHLLKTICKSRAYQHSIRSTKWNEDDQINFSHAQPRRLSAEMLFDAIHAASGSQQRIPGLPVGFRAAELPDAGLALPFLDDFGKPVRESSCECERSSGVVLGPIMKLVNGPTVADALNDPNNALAQLAASQRSDEDILEEVFLRFLSRPPTDSELHIGLQALREIGQDYQLMLDEQAAYEAELPARMQAWLERQDSLLWRTIAPTELSATPEGVVLEPQDDHSVLVSGPHGKGQYVLTMNTPLEKLTGIRVEAMPDDRLPSGGPGRAHNGNFVLSRITLQAASPEAADQWTDIALKDPTASYSQPGYDPIGALDDNGQTGWAIAPAAKQLHSAVFQTAEDVARAGGFRLRAILDFQFEDTHALGRFRISLTDSPGPVTHRQANVELATLLSVPAEARNPRQNAELERLFRQQDQPLKELEARMQFTRQQHDNRRLSGLQDLAWALINGPAFLFNY